DLIQPLPLLLQRHAQARGGKIAYADAKRSVSYADLFRRTGHLAGHLADLGIGRGERVALLLPNSVDWIEACFATTRAGAVSVPIGYDASEPEILYRLNDAACRAIVTTDEKHERVRRMRSDAPQLATILLTDAGSGRGEALRCAELVERAPQSRARDPHGIDEPAYIVYTSGTTGRAKGVLLTLRGMLWVTAACWAPICGLCEQDSVLSPLPLFPSYALYLTVLSVLATGASAYVMERFSTAEALRLLDSGAHTLMPGVPTMYHYLLEFTRAQQEADARSR